MTGRMAVLQHMLFFISFSFYSFFAFFPLSLYPYLWDLILFFGLFFLYELLITFISFSFDSRSFVSLSLSPPFYLDIYGNFIFHLKKKNNNFFLLKKPPEILRV